MLPAAVSTRTATLTLEAGSRRECAARLAITGVIAVSSTALPADSSPLRGASESRAGTRSSLKCCAAVATWSRGRRQAARRSGGVLPAPRGAGLLCRRDLHPAEERRVRDDDETLRQTEQ